MGMTIELRHPYLYCNDDFEEVFAHKNCDPVGDVILI